jgi:hypothetical protein
MTIRHLVIGLVAARGELLRKARDKLENNARGQPDGNDPSPTAEAVDVLLVSPSRHAVAALAACSPALKAFSAGSLKPLCERLAGRESGCCSRLRPRQSRAAPFPSCFGRSDRSTQATADLSEVGPLASEGGGDEDGQGLRLAGQETRGGGEDPGDERLIRHTGSLLEVWMIRSVATLIVSSAGRGATVFYAQEERWGGLSPSKQWTVPGCGR